MLNFDMRVKNSDTAQPYITNMKTPNFSLSSTASLPVFCIGVFSCGTNFPTAFVCVIRGFHIGDAWLGSIRIFDACVKSQHDAQWRASNYRSRLITDFLTRVSKFCRCVTNVKTPILKSSCSELRKPCSTAPALEF